MYLSEFRKVTESMPGDTYLVILSTRDGDTHAITDVVSHRDGGTAYIEAEI